MWPQTAEDVARLAGGDLRGDPKALAWRLLTDSRSAVRSGDLFVGLSGPHFDGGRFAAAVLDQGAAVVLVARSAAEGLDAGPGQAVVEVDNPLSALQALAAEARRRFTGKVVAITGSNGKTTVKDMLAAALGESLRVTASPRSYNSQVGVPISLLQLDPEADVALVECGISQPGEMERLEAMVRPDCGIFVNVGDAHLEGLGDRETTAREKALLFRNVREPGWVVLGAQQPLARGALEALGLPFSQLASKRPWHLPSTQPLSGESGPSSRRPWHPSEDDSPRRPWHLPEPELQSDENGHPVLQLEFTQIPLELGTDSPFLIEDAALAATAALLLGGSPEAVAQGLHQWRPAPMRLEISTTPQGILLINDAYTADPVSMESALEALAAERSPGQAVAVLGGMAQLGDSRLKAHEAVGRRVVELGIDRLVAVGKGGAEIAEGARDVGLPEERIHTVGSSAEAATILEEQCSEGDRVLLKGSRPERLETVAAALFDAISPARLYVDLDAIVENFRAVRQATRRGGGEACGVMAIVKSFGYGLDAVRISRALQRAGVEYLAVAYPDEGALLRRRGITVPILVQNLLQIEAEKIVRHGLTAQVSDAQQIEWLEAEAAAQQRALRVHLKVDTGMGRAGAAPAATKTLALRLASSSWLQFEGLMTHFAVAEDPGQDAFTRKQVACFNEVRAGLAESGLHPRWVHACNSAGLARFPEAHGTMVRCGLALFGYARHSSALEQRPALRLVTRVISIKDLPAGARTGYGLTYQANGPRRLALVALGYSDGYPWALSNRGWMSLHGQRCPVAGRVSMDVTSLDVTDLSPPAAPGDEVTVFGPASHEPSLNELARLAGTIPYEILARLSPRIRRIFRISA